MATIKKLISRLLNSLPKLVTRENNIMSIPGITSTPPQITAIQGTTGTNTTYITSYPWPILNNGTSQCTISGITGAGGSGGAGAGGGSGGGSGYYTSAGLNIYAPTLSQSIITLNSSNKEIVRLNKDGSVTWADEINIDDAADAFSKSMQLGVERMAGITYGVKQRMRDAVFEELIDMASAKGTLSVDDLTYLHQAAKIMDKLKGVKE